MKKNSTDKPVPNARPMVIGEHRFWFEIGKRKLNVWEPDGERTAFNLSEVVERSQYDIDEGRYDGTDDGMIKPSDVSKFIRKMYAGKYKMPAEKKKSGEFVLEVDWAKVWDTKRKAEILEKNPGTSMFKINIITSIEIYLQVCGWENVRCNGLGSLWKHPKLSNEHSWQTAFFVAITDDKEIPLV